MTDPATIIGVRLLSGAGGGEASLPPNIEEVTMWKKVEERKLPRGVVSTSTRGSRLVIGADTSRAWRLGKYRTVDIYTNDRPEVLAFQLYEDDTGAHKLHEIRPDGATVEISCMRALRRAGAEGGKRYLAHRDRDGFITVDFSVPV